VTEKPLILLANDDGVHSRGLRALAEVLVVAPERQRSAA